jgi:hypothetical protein
LLYDLKRSEQKKQDNIQSVPPNASIDFWNLSLNPPSQTFKPQTQNSQQLP